RMGMKSRAFAVTAVLFAAGPAFAQGKAVKPAAPPAGGMAPDMSKMGPATRKPTNEAATKKEIAAFFKENEDLEKQGDLAGAVARVDFPVFMTTDDAKGVPESQAMTKEQYTAIMKPVYEHMPKDMKVTHQPTVTVLSDSLVTFTDEFTMTMGKQKITA